MPINDKMVIEEWTIHQYSHPDEEKLCDFQAFFYLSTWPWPNILSAFQSAILLHVSKETKEKKRNGRCKHGNEEASNGEKQILGNISHVLSNMYC